MTNLSEEEKRKAVQTFLEAEQQRTSSIFDHHTAAISASIARAERKQEIKRNLAQQGITWEQLRDAYDEELSRGQMEMMGFRLSFFYAAAAITYHEYFPSSSPQDVADFMTALQAAPKEAEDTEALNRKCLEETGFDAAVYDTPGAGGPPSRANMPATARASRRDQAAIDRMKRSGITKADVEYERQIGYQNGWNSPFHFSACYGALALVLHSEKGFDAGKIEAFVERLREVEDEEISVQDILERAEREAGIDVSELGAIEG